MSRAPVKPVKVAKPAKPKTSKPVKSKAAAVAAPRSGAKASREGVNLSLQISEGLLEDVLSVFSKEIDARYRFDAEEAEQSRENTKAFWAGIAPVLPVFLTALLKKSDPEIDSTVLSFDKEEAKGLRTLLQSEAFGNFIVALDPVQCTALFKILQAAIPETIDAHMKDLSAQVARAEAQRDREASAGGDLEKQWPSTVSARAPTEPAPASAEDGEKDD